MTENIVEKSIKSFCIWAGVRLVDLANAAGISRQNINYYINENPSLVKYDKTTEVFQIVNNIGATIARGKIRCETLTDYVRQEIPFDDFYLYAGVKKCELMKAAGLNQHSYKNLSNSTCGVFVKYNNKTGDFKIIKPEEIKGYGNIKINRG